MSKTILATIACSALVATFGAAQAQSTPDTAASAGKKMAKDKPVRARDTTTTAAPTAPTTPDAMQIKNTRDGQPMKTSKGAMGSASGATK